MRQLLVVVPTAFLVVSGAAGAVFGDDSDHERARAALQAGEYSGRSRTSWAASRATAAAA